MKKDSKQMGIRSRATASARGDDQFDLAITNVQLVNVLTKEIHAVDIGITGEFIASVLPAGSVPVSAGRLIQGDGLWAAPGFIDGHVHNESSMCTPAAWAEVILPHGATSVVTDPHEIANVLGLRGVKYMLDASRGLPLRYFITTPSCVPSVPQLETAGAVFTAKDISEMLTWERVIAVGEAMDFIGLSNQTGNITPIVETGQAAGVPIEGHGPGLTGRTLQAYLTAAGPRCSDHESLDSANMLEKVRAGTMVYARVSSFLDAAGELADAIHTVPDPRMFGLCTDDLHPGFLLDKGHLDYGMRMLIAAGAEILTVYQMASINVAQHFGLWGLGAIAPGWLADIVLLDDLEKVQVRHVISGGQLRVWDKQLMVPVQQPLPPLPENTVRIPGNLTPMSFTPCTKQNGRVRLHAMDLSNVTDTRLTILELMIENGQVKFPLPEGIALAAVLGRHGQGKPPSLAFITGFPIQKGAIASTVSHDSHNLVMIGKQPADMLRAAQILGEIGGGLAVVDGQKLLSSLPLPIAGLLSPLSVAEIAGQEAAVKASLAGLGLPQEAMAALLFMTLPVIPHVRLTDHGLVDVLSQKIIPLEAG
jgi:adenine deaminase